MKDIPRPRNWYEMGEYLHPGESPEFYRMYAAYWALQAHVDDLRNKLDIKGGKGGDAICSPSTEKEQVNEE